MAFVFVYGTLRFGERNHRLLEGAKRIAAIATVQGDLIDTGAGYPALILGSQHLVAGEIYEVDDECLVRLDELEGYHGPGHPHNHYERVVVEMRTDTGMYEGWTYIYNQPVAERAIIPHGEWKLYNMKKQSSLLYFAYGSCMDTMRMEEAEIADYFSDVVGRGVLEGFHLQFTHPSSDGGKADIVETGGIVEGKLYRIPTEILEDYLYWREGVGLHIYRPVVVPVRQPDGTFVAAVTFVVVHKEEETPPSIIYQIEILRGAKSIVSERYYATLLKRFETMLRSVNIQMLPQHASMDMSEMEHLTCIINRVYKASEQGLWVQGTTRTTVVDVAKFTAAGEIAVATINGRIVGCIHIYRKGETGEFGMLAVDERFQGIGIGAQLVRFAEEHCRQKKLPAIQLELLVPMEGTHPAKANLEKWYSRNGYIPVQTGAVADSFPLLAPRLAVPCQFIVMQKKLI